MTGIGVCYSGYGYEYLGSHREYMYLIVKLPGSWSKDLYESLQARAKDLALCRMIPHLVCSSLVVYLENHDTIG